MPQIERDAVDFWRRLGNLPPDVAPEQRARELTAVAYKDGRIVGVHHRGDRLRSSRFARGWR